MEEFEGVELGLFLKADRPCGGKGQRRVFHQADGEAERSGGFGLAAQTHRIFGDIDAAAADLNLKADRYEWQLRRFVQTLLDLIGHPTEDIRFSRQTIANDSEVVEDIYRMRADIDQRTALRLNPYIQEEEIEGLLTE